MFNNNFSDKNKFKLLTRNEYAEDKNYKIVEEKYMNIDNNCEIIRKLRFKNIYKDIKVRLTQSQIDCINERLKWDKFGSELTTPAEITKGEDEFIQYNPEILKSKKSKKYIEENNMSSYIEPIFLDSNFSLEDLMIQDEKLYDLLKDNQTKYLQKCKTERLEFEKAIKLELETFKGQLVEFSNKPAASKTVSAPTLRQGTKQNYIEFLNNKL